MLIRVSLSKFPKNEQKNLMKLYFTDGSTIIYAKMIDGLVSLYRSARYTFGIGDVNIFYVETDDKEPMQEQLSVLFKGTGSSVNWTFDQGNCGNKGKNVIRLKAQYSEEETVNQVETIAEVLRHNLEPNVLHKAILKGATLLMAGIKIRISYTSGLIIRAAERDEPTTPEIRLNPEETTRLQRVENFYIQKYGVNWKVHFLEEVASLHTIAFNLFDRNVIKFYSENPLFKIREYECWFVSFSTSTAYTEKKLLDLSKFETGYKCTLCTNLQSGDIYSILNHYAENHFKVLTSVELAKFISDKLN